MRVYLGIVARRPGVPVAPDLLRSARNLIADAFPVPEEAIARDEWVSPSGSVVLLGWSNEPDSGLLPGILTAGPQGSSLGYCGYLAESADAARVLRWDTLAGASELGGVFSLFRASRDVLEAATGLARVCPVYYAQAAEVTIVGSRALLVHLTAQHAAGDPGLSIDVPSLVPLVHHGFFTTDATPFSGVKALPAASVLIARADGAVDVDVVQATLPPYGTAGQFGRKAAVEDLAEALVTAAAPLGRSGSPVRLSLSGGRDSRLMAVTLQAAGLPFRAFTHGFADDPDVILARRIAGILGVEHEVELTAPQQADVRALTVGHPLARVIHVIRMCEGMTSGYESVDRYQPFTLTPATSGSGGETLRGGFLYDQKDITPAGLARRVRSLFHSADWVLTPEAIESFRPAGTPWEAVNGFTALDQIYLHYRTGRWIVGSHTATLRNRLYYHPYFDNRVVRAAMRLSPRWRWTEEPFYRAIETLNPAVAAVPPEGKRWRFEAGRPRNPARWSAWHRSAPVMPSGRTSGFNWRKSADPALLDILTGQVLDGPKDLFGIVDRAKAEELFRNLRTGKEKGWTNQVWHLYTLSVLLDGTWRRDRTPASLPEITIPIP